MQYTPGVFAGYGGNDNRGDWLKVRGFEPTIFLDGMQSYFGYYNNVAPEPFLLSSVAVLKGPAGMLYGNGAVGGRVRYVGPTWASGVETPDVTLPDAMIGYQWDRYLVRLTGRNLADETYVVNCDPFTCYCGDTRTIGLSLTAAF